MEFPRPNQPDTSVNLTDTKLEEEGQEVDSVKEIPPHQIQHEEDKLNVSEACSKSEFLKDYEVYLSHPSPLDPNDSALSLEALSVDDDFKRDFLFQPALASMHRNTSPEVETTLQNYQIPEPHPNFEFHDCKVRPSLEEEIAVRKQTRQFVVQNVNSPEDFYLQNTSRLDTLDQLEKEMTDWYNGLASRRIPQTESSKDGRMGTSKPIFPAKAAIVLHGYYAAYIPEKQRWLRCYVDKLITWSKIKILLLDHGTTHVTARRNILPLRKDYAQLPIQAYLGKIYVVNKTKPIRFNSESKQTFKTETEDQIFIISIVDCCISDAFPLLSVLFLTKVQNGRTVKGYRLTDQLHYGLLISFTHFYATDSDSDPN